MHKYKLILSYDGTNYSGFQVQKNASSIQQLLEQALQTILRIATPVWGAGRTDAGVHALGQVVHFIFSSSIDQKKLLASLNGLLPEDIRVLSIEAVAAAFHARYSALSKVYRYHCHLGAVHDPFKLAYAYHIPYPIDLALLKKAIPHFVGTRDFTSFAHEALKGSAAKNPCKTIYRLDCVEEENGFRLEFEADGFLYKMVRNIVSTLLSIGSNKLCIDEIPNIFRSRDRRMVPATAPPHGLFLVRVNYPEIDSGCIQKE
jgi:tRNA pseudouridine38-40 synthase